MRSGKLRHKIEIWNKPDSIPDSFGHESVDPIQVGYVWGSIATLSASETEQARSTIPVRTVEIRTRFSTLINQQSELRYRGKVYNVESIDNIDERNIELKITAGLNA